MASFVQQATRRNITVLPILFPDLGTVDPLPVLYTSPLASRGIATPIPSPGIGGVVLLLWGIPSCRCVALTAGGKTALPNNGGAIPTVLALSLSLAHPILTPLDCDIDYDTSTDRPSRHRRIHRPRGAGQGRRVLDAELRQDLCR